MSPRTTLPRLLGRLARIVKPRPAPAAPAEPHVRPIVESDPADVFLAAYPKSGITWLQNLVAGALYGLDPEQMPDRLVQDLVPDVHYKRTYKRYRAPMCFKTHHLPRPEYRRVVYLMRDGRDVLVSYWHHLQALGRRPIDFAALVEDPEMLPWRWHEHVEAWRANPFGAELLTVRYEDLRADAARELARVCTFAGEPRDAAAIAQVAARCTFEAMRRREERFGWDNVDWPKDRPFVRRGVSGSYRDEMPPAVLERFLAEAGETLRACGYAV